MRTNQLNKGKPATKNKPIRTRYCQYCGRIFTLPHGRKGNARKYCSKQCSHASRLENNLSAVRRYQQRWKEFLKNKPSFNKYRGRLGVHPDPDFDEEYRKIQNELKRFKLRK